MWFLVKRYDCGAGFNRVASANMLASVGEMSKNALDDGSVNSTFRKFNNSSSKCQQLALVNGKPFISVKSIVNNRSFQRKMMK